ncbi:MAG: polynucleotide adenylyltransferase PcnB, partial [Chlamydiia bacterium]|nr:polynucleotide adenylyltransferase PcnB [Chlamydiia bacterium]
GIETIEPLLQTIDSIHQNETSKPLHRSLLIACLLFPIIEKALHFDFLSKDHTPHLGEITQLTHATIRDIVTTSFTHFPRRISAIVSYILSTQYRFHPFSGRVHYPPRVFRHKDFPLALYFLKIRALNDSELMPVYAGWRDHYRRFIQQHDPKKHHSPPTKKVMHE